MKNLVTFLDQRRPLLRSALYTSVALALHSTGVVAQEQEDATGLTSAVEQPGSGGLKLEEIIVMGEKRDRNLQLVPQAISAVTGERIDRLNITSPTNLTARAPGLVVTREEGFERAVTIRGLGKNSTQAGIGQSVAIHQDGVFFADTVSLNVDLYDIERIEVLRGPQGTVFGQNAIGGVLNIITKQPSLDGFEGKVDVALGTDSLVQTRGMVNVPITDKFAVRATGQFIEQDGFTDNIELGQELDETDNTSFRIQGLYRPTDNLSITGRYQYFDTDVNGRAQKSIFDSTPDPRELRQDFPSFFSLESNVYSLEVEWDLPFATIKSISSFQDTEPTNQQDLDRGTRDFTNFIDPSDTTGANTGVVTADRILRNNPAREVWTTELNVVSSEGGKLDWIAGFFYSDIDTEIDFLEMGDFNFDGMVASEEDIDPENPFATADLAFSSMTDQNIETVAVYGQATYHLTERFRATAGLRYNEEDFENEGFNLFVLPTTAETEEELLTGKAGLEYDLAEDVMIFGNFTRGAKPGGGSLSSGILVEGTFEEETVNAYELGLKSRFLDGQLQLNASAYYYDFEDFQFLTADPVPFSGGVVNIPESENKGIELEATALLPMQTQLDITLSYMDSEITSDFLAIDNVLAVEQDARSFIQGNGLFSDENIDARLATAVNLDGNALPRTPEWSGTVNLSRDFGLGSLGQLTLSVNYMFIDDMLVRPFDNPERDRVPSYDLWGASAIWDIDDKWRLELTGSNLEDDDVLNNRFTDAFGVAATGDLLVPPRIVKFRVSYLF